MKFDTVLKTTIADSIAIREQCHHLSPAISEVIHHMVKSYSDHGKIIVFGNGGAAADAQHIVGELVGRFRFERPALAAIALVGDASVTTAIGNDYGYDQLFARQIMALGQPGDIAIGITTSGTSTNVISGLASAKKAGLTTIGMCGTNTTHLKPICDVVIDVPSSDTARIQEALMMIGHVICESVEERIFGNLTT
ncbi:MAG: SIS domain-containing protein [Chloroflexota bacterium]|nr:SIS domain-containing protein [Chloroflexota bacterium]